MCACCRLAWEWLPETGQAAVGVAERYADGDATADERWDAFQLLVESAGGRAVRETVALSWGTVGVDWATLAAACAVMTDREALICDMDGRLYDRLGGGEGMCARATI